jgi:hypothetical protein
VDDETPEVLSYEVPAPLRRDRDPRPVRRRPMMLWLIARQLAFMLGVGLFSVGIVMCLRGHYDDAEPLVGWGAALVALCVPLGPLPWFFQENGPP